jgi:hypothetical protein
MPCGGKRCIPAIDVALSGALKQEALAKKLCGLIDLIALLRNQISLDQSDGQATPSSTTQSLATELVRQIDAIDVYTADSTGAKSSASEAVDWGLVCDVNCRLLNVLIKNCVIEVNSTTNYTLSDIQDATINYNIDYIVTPAEFLCCISEHFARLQAFLERYVDAKKCESVC